MTEGRKGKGENKEETKKSKELQVNERGKG